MNKHTNITLPNTVLKLYKMKASMQAEAEQCNYKSFVDAEII